MNPHELERLLLLEQSGELAPRQRRALDAELAASETARRLRNQLRVLATAAPEPAAAPAPDAAARIAARLRKNHKPASAFQPAWKPALAAAAALALFVGVRSFQRPASTSAPAETAAIATAAEEEDWTDPLDAEFTELESLLAAMSTDAAFEITEL